jgi:hypothetical protein
MGGGGIAHITCLFACSVKKTVNLGRQSFSCCFTYLSVGIILDFEVSSSILF